MKKDKFLWLSIKHHDLHHYHIMMCILFNLFGHIIFILFSYLVFAYFLFNLIVTIIRLFRYIISLTFYVVYLFWF